MIVVSYGTGIMLPDRRKVIYSQEDFLDDQEAIDTCLDHAKKAMFDFEIRSVNGSEDNQKLKTRIEEAIKMAHHFFLIPDV